MIRREWSPAPRRRKRWLTVLWIFCGIALFLLGFFAAHPLLSLFGAV